MAEHRLVTPCNDKPFVLNERGEIVCRSSKEFLDDLRLFVAATALLEAAENILSDLCSAEPSFYHAIFESIQQLQAAIDAAKPNTPPA